MALTKREWNSVQAITRTEKRMFRGMGDSQARTMVDRAWSSLHDEFPKYLKGGGSPVYPRRIQAVQDIARIFLPDADLRHEYLGESTMGLPESGLFTAAMEILQHRNNIDVPGGATEIRQMMRQVKVLILATLRSRTPNYFRFPEDLCHQLARTTLKGLMVSDLKFPFEGFYIEIPEGVLDLHHPVSGWHSCRCIGVTGQGPAYLGCVLGLPDADGTSDISVVLADCPFMTVFCYGEPNENSVNIFDDCTQYFPTPLIPGFTLDEVIEWQRANSDFAKAMNKAMGLTTAVPHPDNEGLEETGLIRLCGEEYDSTAEKHSILMFVMNALVAMTAPNIGLGRRNQDEIDQLKAKLKRTKKNRMRLRQRIIALDAKNLWDVGTKLKKPPSAHAGGEGSRDFKQWKNPGVSVTMGHWKRQPCGPGRAERKLIYIEPYVRVLGNADEEARGHDYRMKEV